MRGGGGTTYHFVMPYLISCFTDYLLRFTGSKIGLSFPGERGAFKSQEGGIRLRVFSHWHGIHTCACLLGRFFTKLGIAIGGVSSETREPKFYKLDVFWANYCKKTPNLVKIGCFLSKMVYWWVGTWAKIGIEKVRFSRSGRHIQVRFWWK